MPAAEEMADWYWTKQEFAECTPSRKDGITLEEEKRYRKDGARLIILCSTSLGLYSLEPCLCSSRGRGRCPINDTGRYIQDRGPSYRSTTMHK